MAELLEQLYVDHRNMARLLKLVEKELDEFHQRGKANLSLINRVMTYLTDYSDVIHHPKEDVMLERLGYTQPDFANAIDALMAQHDMLATKGMEFLKIVEEAEEGQAQRLDTLEEMGRDFVSRQFQHMRHEETEILPAARKSFSTADWQAIDDAVSPRADPLFGDTVEEEFRELYEHILSNSSPP
ncbi:MAG: hemerythrin domain-containing protein [Gammaproteobacteria bacterium]|nr:hemerythrin domain-containing protein [Gammaproteobacteria bacterium]